MAILMKCRHCQQTMGSVEDLVTVYDAIIRNGFTQEEINDMIQQDELGNSELHLICEECEEILAQNPSLFENENFIH
ncbi:anti-sigma-F factor Fin [Bacillaceae bacterium W0354]